jgi:DNA-binding transcriptional ArsR family regulator
MPGPRPDQAAEALSALGDSQRRAIVELLGERERSVREIAEALPISRPAVSRHLRLLKDAGLVAEEPRGTRRIHRLRADGADAVRAYLEELWGQAAVRFRLLAENTAGTPPDTGPDDHAEEEA